MNICGIVCEYNPFHNGHAYHIQKAKEITSCDLLVCVMSGNVVQRGEMAICDKWERARTAIENGCDLVVELPYPFVVQRADRFAHGALQVLKQAGINSIVFGSECADIHTLTRYAQKQIDYSIHQTQGVSCAKALETVFDERLSSNDMLAIFYIRETFGTAITPYAIKRTNSYHDLDTSDAIASASAIRHAFHNKEDITHMTSMNPDVFMPYTWSDYYPYLQTQLMTANTEQLASLFLVDEGIEGLLKKQAAQHMDYASFLDACTSRRYTKASLQRTLMHILTQTSKQEINTLMEPDYLRILAFNSAGRAHLRTLQDQGIAVASIFSQIPAAYRQMELRLTAARAYPYPMRERKILLENELRPPVSVL